jgi:hypothetical protein
MVTTRSGFATIVSVSVLVLFEPSKSEPFVPSSEMLEVLVMFSSPAGTLVPELKTTSIVLIIL